MPRTVLGWRCRRGSGRSLPTSYTSPQAANKPLIVLPIHTDRGRHCLSAFTPCDLHGPWLTPPKCSTLSYWGVLGRATRGALDAKWTWKTIPVYLYSWPPEACRYIYFSVPSFSWKTLKIKPETCSVMTLYG